MPRHARFRNLQEMKTFSYKFDDFFVENCKKHCLFGSCDLALRGIHSLLHAKKKLILTMALRHDVAVRWFACSMCEFRSKQKANPKRHMACIHGVDVKWFPCSMCDYRAKQKQNLKTHMASTHDVDVQWFPCSMCDYRAKTKGILEAHMACKHDVDVQWFPCCMCDYRAKRKSSLDRHIAFKHDVAVATPRKKQKCVTKVAGHLEQFDVNKKENIKEVEDSCPQKR